jgi:mRNA interferase RelE/StbE
LPYQVLIPKPVQKQITLLPQKVQDLVVEKILGLKENPNPAGSKKLNGSKNEYRLRIGNYRLIYE